jgi:hypothetical protein
MDWGVSGRRSGDGRLVLLGRAAISEVLEADDEPDKPVTE